MAICETAAPRPLPQRQQVAGAGGDLAESGANALPAPQAQKVIAHFTNMSRIRSLASRRPPLRWRQPRSGGNFLETGCWRQRKGCHNRRLASTESLRVWGRSGGVGPRNEVL